MTVSSSALDQLQLDLEQNLSDGRLRHILSVKETALSLGQTHRADLETLKVSALIHDLAREMNIDTQASILRDEGMLDHFSLMNPVLMHAKVAAVLGIKKYGFPEKCVEPAKWHTTGRAEMSREDIILYIADQIEPGRPWSSKSQIEQAHTNLFDSLKKCMLLKLEFTLKRGKMIHPDSIHCWNWLYSTNS